MRNKIYTHKAHKKKKIDKVNYANRFFAFFYAGISLISLRHRDGNRRYAFATLAPRARARVFCSRRAPCARARPCVPLASVKRANDSPPVA